MEFIVENNKRAVTVNVATKPLNGHNCCISYTNGFGIRISIMPPNFLLLKWETDKFVGLLKDLKAIAEDIETLSYTMMSIDEKVKYMLGDTKITLTKKRGNGLQIDIEEEGTESSTCLTSPKTSGQGAINEFRKFIAYLLSLLTCLK